MDKFGFPLSPQPLMNDAKDPLTWSRLVKIKILMQISLISWFSLFTSQVISPALWPLSRALHVPLVEAGYVVGSFVLLLGVAPFIWNPLSHSYGRRPIYLIGLVGSLATSICCGLSRRYFMLIILRALNGLFAGAAIGLGTVVCCDIFYAHQRGLYLGIYTVMHMSGGQLAPLVGGFIYKRVNWHWCFFMPAIAFGALLVSFALTVPETLYSRSVESLRQPQMSEYQRERLMKKRRESRKIKFSNFSRQFKMLRYPSVLIPAISYSVASGYGNMVFVMSSAIIFHRVYHFHTWQIGLLLGVPLTIGSFIGEFGAGGFSDWVIRRRAVGRGGKRIAEDRLYAMIPGVTLLPVGLMVEAYSIHNRTHWVGPGLGIAIASAGLQVVTTVTYAYTADCYSRQVGEIGSILNFGRQIFCFCVGFYAIPFAWRFGLQTAWITFAIVEILCFLPIIPLIMKGAEWRELFLPPDWNLDL
ncbi:MFS general substrate transporter [Tothia fuscella]|uniref:MFS general substrate transporter n=1 Tax=Tothia fuscella TaxID=1048955 RepID=A0A9P4NXX7_9PEZI|nr:MFS general substrate transporter [Tothia fuscella]